VEIKGPINAKDLSPEEAIISKKNKKLQNNKRKTSS
jgi:hypothetical protein